MPVVQSMIKNSSQNVLYSGILFFLSCVAAYILWCNHEIFTQVIEDSSSLFLMLFGSVTVILFSSFMHLFLLFAFEYFVNGNNLNVLSRLWRHLNGHSNLWIFVCLNIVLVGLYLFMELKFSWSYLKVIISASILFACMIFWTNYDDVELSSCQTMEQSIGACWAYGAYLAFYKKVLQNITKRMSQYEKKHNVTLLVKKLVIICPLSCNANGSLEDKDGNIEAAGRLEDIIEDEGANINRTYKTNVYKIKGPSEYYIAAEIPSPLATLYEMRDVMDSVILQYHRESFIKTFSDLVRSDQCIILEYDDLNSSEPLHRFLLSKLEDKNFVNVLK